MKILVDNLPVTCSECDYCAKAMIMSQLGVPKEVSLCTVQTTLIPPKTPDEEPNFLEVDKAPELNNCPFKNRPYTSVADAQLGKEYNAEKHSSILISKN